jgi:copper chaperone CopZ
MTKIYFIEGMSCGSCVAKVKTALQKVEGINSVEVQLQIPQAIIKADAEIPLSILQAALDKAGHYQIKEAALTAQSNTKKSGSGCCC